MQQRASDAKQFLAALAAGLAPTASCTVAFLAGEGKWALPGFAPQAVPAARLRFLAPRADGVAFPLVRSSRIGVTGNAMPVAASSCWNFLRSATFLRCSVESACCCMAAAVELGESVALPGWLHAAA